MAGYTFYLESRDAGGPRLGLLVTRKHAAREERRVARASRKKDREAGLIEPGPPIGEAEQSEWLRDLPEDEEAEAADAATGAEDA